MKRVPVYLPDDGYSWVKYGEKKLTWPSRTRSYFRCASYAKLGCKAKKTVDFPDETACVRAFTVGYKGSHNHRPVTEAAASDDTQGSETRVTRKRRNTTSMPVSANPILETPGLSPVLGLVYRGRGPGNPGNPGSTGQLLQVVGTDCGCHQAQDSTGQLQQVPPASTAGVPSQPHSSPQAGHPFSLGPLNPSAQQPHDLRVHGSSPFILHPAAEMAPWTAQQDRIRQHAGIPLGQSQPPPSAGTSEPHKLPSWGSTEDHAGGLLGHLPQQACIPGGSLVQPHRTGDILPCPAPPRPESFPTHQPAASPLSVGFAPAGWPFMEHQPAGMPPLAQTTCMPSLANQPASMPSLAIQPASMPSLANQPVSMPSLAQPSSMPLPFQQPTSMHSAAQLNKALLPQLSQTIQHARWHQATSGPMPPGSQDVHQPMLHPGQQQFFTSSSGQQYSVPQGSQHQGGQFYQQHQLVPYTEHQDPCTQPAMQHKTAPGAIQYHAGHSSMGAPYSAPPSAAGAPTQGLTWHQPWLPGDPADQSQAATIQTQIQQSSAQDSMRPQTQVRLDSGQPLSTATHGVREDETGTSQGFQGFLEPMTLSLPEGTSDLFLPSSHGGRMSAPPPLPSSTSLPDTCLWESQGSGREGAVPCVSDPFPDIWLDNDYGFYTGSPSSSPFLGIVDED